MDAGEYRQHEALVVIVVVDVHDRLAVVELLGGREVGRSVQGLVRCHVDGNIHDGVERPPRPLRHVGI